MFLCFFEDKFFVVQVEPLEEHLISIEVAACSSIPGAYCCLRDLFYIISELFVCGLESVRRLQLHDSGWDRVPLG